MDWLSGVGILEGSEVNNSTLDNIYEVFDQAGKEIGVADVPVAFKHEGFVQVDEGIVEKAVDDIEKAEEPSGAEETNKTKGSTEDTRKPVNVSGLGAIFTLLVILISAFILKRR